MKKLKMGLLIASIVILAGCRDSETSSTSAASDVTTKETGVFLDSAVANITYQTETQTGVTNEDGEYEYLPGETVIFSIGSITFPSVTASGIVTPKEIAGTEDINDSKVINMIRLLQTLDKDGNPDNGITITDTAKENAVAVDFTLSVDAFASSDAVSTVIKNAGQDTPPTVLVTKEAALEHFEKTISELDPEIPIVEGITFDIKEWIEGNFSIEIAKTSNIRCEVETIDEDDRADYNNESEIAQLDFDYNSYGWSLKLSTDGETTFETNIATVEDEVRVKYQYKGVLQKTINTSEYYRKRVYLYDKKQKLHYVINDAGDEVLKQTVVFKTTELDEEIIEIGYITDGDFIGFVKSYEDKVNDTETNYSDYTYDDIQGNSEDDNLLDDELVRTKDEDGNETEEEINTIYQYIEAEAFEDVNVTYETLSNDRVQANIDSPAMQYELIAVLLKSGKTEIDWDDLEGTVEKVLAIVRNINNDNEIHGYELTYITGNDSRINNYYSSNPLDESDSWDTKGVAYSIYNNTTLGAIINLDSFPYESGEDLNSSGGYDTKFVYNGKGVGLGSGDSEPNNIIIDSFVNDGTMLPLYDKYIYDGSNYIKQTGNYTEYGEEID